MDPIILLLRIIVPLSIVRFPLVGGLISIWLDGLDWQTNFFNLPDLHHNYQPLDKALDIYYLTLEVYTVHWWRNRLANRVAWSLYIYRLAGVILFELTKIRLLLFIFPNIFEGFFLFYLGAKTLLGKEPRLTFRLTAVGVGVLTILKLIQEYPMHVKDLWQWRYIQVSLFSRAVEFQYDNLIHQFLIILGLVFWFTFIFKKHEYTRPYYLTIKKFYSSRK